MGHCFGRARAIIIAAAGFVLASTLAQAQDRIRIGVLNDQSGVFATYQGFGSVIAAQMAVEDYGGKATGKTVEVVSADHQNKPDIGVAIARRWYENENVDAIFDLPNSSIALAVANMTEQKNKVFVGSGAGTALLTGEKCTPNTVHWTYDTWMLANGTGKAVVQTGGDTWFFLTADYAFGQALERDTSKVVIANGGKVVGSVRHPLNTSDFSSFLLQAQSSKAKIIGLANAGGDTINAIKQGAEFGIAGRGQHFAGLLVFINDVEALGLKTAQGLVLTETWYWDMTDANRAFTKRWQVASNRPGKFPSMLPAGVYSSVIHYLKAVEALKSDSDGRAVVAKMKELPTDDPLFGKGSIRIDGRKLHDAYLFEVKKPEESKYPGDDYKLRATIPAAEAFRPLKEGGCPLVGG